MPLVVREVELFRQHEVFSVFCNHINVHWEKGGAGHRGLLLDAAAEVNFRDPVDGATPLHMASQMKHTDVALLLLESGAAVDATADNGLTPMRIACEDANLPLVWLLSAHGAARSAGIKRRARRADRWHAERIAHWEGHSELLSWLVRSRSWCSPLHHASLLSPSHTRRLLRGGADLHARRRPPVGAPLQGLGANLNLYVAGGERTAAPSPPAAPSPLELAQGVRSEEAGFDSARLVVQAAGEWSPASHALWPDALRARAVALTWLGWLLARSSDSPGPFAGQEQGLSDVWQARVIPLALELERGASG